MVSGSSRRIRTLGVLASLAVVAVGCGVDGEGSTDTSADEIQTAKPIAPIDYVHCWVAPDTTAPSDFFQAHELRCAQPSAGDYPLVPEEVTIELHTARGNASHADLAGETLIGRFRNEDLPITLYTKLRFGRSTTVGEAFALKEQRSIAALADATKAKPLAFVSPFTLWGVAISASPGTELHYVRASRYEVPTGTFKVGYNFTIPDTSASVLPVAASAEARDGRVEVALIAPASGPIALNVDGRDVTLAGPGAYVFDGSKLAKVDAAGPPPSPDLVEPPPQPTCGTENTPVCPGNACAPGHRLASSVCKPCGLAEQTYCGTYEERTCSPGHRIVGDVCKVCGGDGQTYCGTYAERTCSPGHRVVGDVCKVCGGDGQTYCGTYSARSCNEGLRVVGDLCRR